MKEHLTQRQIDEFRARKLSPQELFAASEHLAVCEACRTQIETARSVGAGGSFLQSEFSGEARFPEHLSFEQLRAFAENSLDEIDREIVESHLSACRVCEREAFELRDFAASIEPQTIPVSDASEPAFWEKLRLFIFTPAFGASFGVLLVLGIFLGIYFSTKNNSPGVITENKPTPTPSNPVVNPISNPTPETANSNVQPEKNSDEKQITEPQIERAENELPTVDALDKEAEILRGELKNGKIETPRDLNDLFARTGNFMGGQATSGKTFKIETPFRTIINETQPVLRWQKLADADEYRVGIYDENFNEVAKVQTKTNRIRVAKALKRGTIYFWEVEALKEGKPIASAPAANEAEAKFKVLDAAKANLMQKELRKNSRSPLWKGIVYARFGLLAEAERELAIYARQNPKSKEAKNLLRQIRALRK